MSCDDHTEEEQGVKYGEELLASLPMRAEEISIWQADSRMARALFEVGGSQGIDHCKSQMPKPRVQEDTRPSHVQDSSTRTSVELDKMISRDLA
jgi:hypothetical protein